MHNHLSIMQMMSMGSATVPYPAVLPGPHMPNLPAAAAPAAHLGCCSIPLINDNDGHPLAHKLLDIQSFLRDMISIVTHLLSAYTDTRPDVYAQNGPNIHSIATSALTGDYQQHTTTHVVSPGAIRNIQDSHVPAPEHQYKRITTDTLATMTTNSTKSIN
ncbi:hypothetical protein Tco_1363954, partial [Tanacetum coccineum]